MWIIDICKLQIIFDEQMSRVATFPKKPSLIEMSKISMAKSAEVYGATGNDRIFESRLWLSYSLNSSEEIILDYTNCSSNLECCQMNVVHFPILFY